MHELVLRPWLMCLCEREVYMYFLAQHIDITAESFEWQGMEDKSFSEVCDMSNKLIP